MPSVFFQGVAPPTIRLHLRLYSDLTSPNCEIPSLKAARTADGLASEAETRAFELWLRQLWQEKEARLEQTSKLSPFEAEAEGSKAEVVPIRQLSVERVMQIAYKQCILTLVLCFRRRRDRVGGR